PFQTVADHHQDVPGAAVLDLGADPQPVLGPLPVAVLPGPQAQEAALAVCGDAQRQVDGPVRDLTLADLHVDRVDENHRINSLVSSGRDCHSARPSITRSVIAVIVCLETSAPYTSARCAAISPWVSPFAGREITISSTPVRRRCLLATIFGSKLESRSRGTESSTGPASVRMVLARRPLRELPPSRPSGSCLPWAE